MSDKQKKQILFGILISIMVIFPLILYHEYRIGEEYVKDFEKAFESKEPKIVLLAHPNCVWCSYYEPILKEFSEDFGFEYTYFNVGAVSKKQRNKVLESLNIKLSTPQTFLVQNQTVLSELAGYKSEKELLDWLKKYQFTKEKPMLNYIDYDQYYKNLKDPEKKIIIFGSVGSKNSDEAKKILKEIIREYNINIYYLNIYDYIFGFLKQEDSEKFEQSLENLTYLEKMPVTLILEGEIVIERKDGLLEKEEYIKLLKTHDFIK